MVPLKKINLQWNVSSWILIIKESNRSHSLCHPYPRRFESCPHSCCWNHSNCSHCWFGSDDGVWFPNSVKDVSRFSSHYEIRIHNETDIAPTPSPKCFVVLYLKRFQAAVSWNRWSHSYDVSSCLSVFHWVFKHFLAYVHLLCSKCWKTAYKQDKTKYILFVLKPRYRLRYSTLNRSAATNFGYIRK